MKHLLGEWGEIKKQIRDKSIFLFLDFDGTIAPIVDTPDKAVLPGEAKALLTSLIKCPRLKIAFISGRKLIDLKNKVGLKGAIYSGNHGLEIEGPKISFEPVLSSRYRATLGRIKKILENKILLIPGVFIEDKGLSLSLHYRLANKDQASLIKTIFHETIIVYLVKNQIKIKLGKKVLEVRPPVVWDKGKVVLWLLSRQKFVLNKNNILPIYIGDDITDEDAFRALRKNGLTIYVGAPKKSSARYYVKSTVEVNKFLEGVLKICQN